MEVPSHVVSRSSGAVARAAENQAGGEVMTRSVSDLLSYPQLSRVCGMLGSRSRWGGVAWAFWWKPAPSAAPRARWGHLAGWVQVAFTRWSRVTARAVAGPVSRVPPDAGRHRVRVAGKVGRAWWRG